jgi:hypothetical protein
MKLSNKNNLLSIDSVILKTKNTIKEFLFEKSGNGLTDG